MKKAWETTQHMANRSFFLLFFVFISLVACKSSKGLEQKTDSADTAAFDNAFFRAQRFKATGEGAKAYSFFKSALDIDPACDACYFELSRYDFKDNRIDQAIAKINQAIDLNSSNQWYITARGEYLMEAAQYNSASNDFRWLIDRESKNLDDYYNLINAHLYQEQGKEAIAVFNEMENVFGTDYETSAQKLDLIRRISSPEIELAELDQLIEKQKYESRWYIRKAELLQSMSRSDEAFEFLEKSTKLTSSSGAIYLQLADWYHSKDNSTKGLEMLQKAYQDVSLEAKAKISSLAYYFNESITNNEFDAVLELINILQTSYPEESDVFIAKGDFHTLVGQNNEAIDQYILALKLDPSQLPTWEQVMDLQHAQLQWQALAESSSDALELFPTQPFVYLMNGTALLNLDNYTDALTSLKAGQMMVFDDPFTQAQFAATLGQTYHQMKDYANSDLAFDKAVDLDGNNSFILNNYAYYLSLRKDHLSKARSLIERCVELSPNIASFEDTYGWILFEMKEYNEALIWIEKALQNGGSTDGLIIEHHGDVLSKLNRTQESVEVWKKAKKQGGASLLIDKKIENKQYYAE